MEKEINICLENVERAKEFVAIAEKFKGDIDLLSGRYIVNGKSILGVLSLVLSDHMTASLHSDDQEELDKFVEVMKPFLIA